MYFALLTFFITTNWLSKFFLSNVLKSDIVLFMFNVNKLSKDGMFRQDIVITPYLLEIQHLAFYLYILKKLFLWE